MPEISIKPEPLFHLFGFAVTNSLFTSSIVMLLSLWIAFYYRNQSKNAKKGNFYYFLNFLLKNVYDLFKSIVGSDKIGFFFPVLGSFFCYILIQNWFGLLPGVGSILLKMKEHGEELAVPLLRGNNADLNTTLVLGIVAVVLVQYAGVKYLGWKDHLKKYFNFKGPIDFFIGALEIISEFSRVLSFAFRLFGNIFAGEVLLTIVAFLVPVLASFPFLMLEIFVGLVQALVFSMLTAVFINVATIKHH